jgi:hypothetical protein
MRGRIYNNSVNERSFFNHLSANIFPLWDYTEKHREVTEVHRGHNRYLRNPFLSMVTLKLISKPIFFPANFI